MECKLTAIILQARLDSSRLPGKAMLPLAGRPLVLRVMEALNHINAGLRVLACPEDSFDTFKPLAKEAGFEIIAGPKEDVLERYCMAIRKYSIDTVIRATGDNPFVFADTAAMLFDEASAVNADYAGYIDLPYGSGVEYVSAKALLRAANEAALPQEREHVCPYLYNNPQIFNLYRPAAPVLWLFPDIRLTVDTQEDYECAVMLYDALEGNPKRHNGSEIINTYKNIFPIFFHAGNAEKRGDRREEKS